MLRVRRGGVGRRGGGRRQTRGVAGGGGSNVVGVLHATVVVVWDGQILPCVVHVG